MDLALRVHVFRRIGDGRGRSALLAEVGWSTTIVEQGHGSLATIHKYYPEYGSGPFDLMVWLHQQATLSEQQNSADYGKPQLGGRNAGQSEEPEDINEILARAEKSSANKGFGKATKQLSKTQQAKLDAEKREAEQERIRQQKAKILEKGGVEKTDE